jgi:hypothetical protein
MDEAEPGGVFEEAPRIGPVSWPGARLSAGFHHVYRELLPGEYWLFEWLSATAHDSFEGRR